jgi:hypothetical protein
MPQLGHHFRARRNVTDERPARKLPLLPALLFRRELSYLPTLGLRDDL